VEFLDVHGDWAAITRHVPQLTREACLADMHGIDRAGRLHAGFDTYRALAGVLPLGWLIRPFLYVPPVPWLGRRVYRAIADRRHAAACALPTRAATSQGPSDSGHGTAGAAPAR
jgi:predicted DCC family thiol-disulfide oxidoreductase YuxK